MKKSINRLSGFTYRVVYNEASALETFVFGVGIAVVVFLIGYYILFPLSENQTGLK